MAYQLKGLDVSTSYRSRYPMPKSVFYSIMSDIGWTEDADAAEEHIRFADQNRRNFIWYAGQSTADHPQLIRYGLNTVADVEDALDLISEYEPEFWHEIPADWNGEDIVPSQPVWQADVLSTPSPEAEKILAQIRINRG